MKTGPAYLCLVSIFVCILFFNCSKSASAKHSEQARELLSVYSTGSPELSTLTRLLNSSRYSEIEDFVDTYGTLTINNASVVYYNNDTSKPWITIPVINHANTVGFVRIVKIADAKSQIVGKKYIASFVNFSDGFSESNPSGIVEVFDLDDNNSLVGQYLFSNGVPIDDLLYDDSRAHYCDKNRDGNVTFGECMTCMVGACFGNTECAAQCIMYQFLANACLISFTTSCQIISIIY